MSLQLSVCLVRYQINVAYVLENVSEKIPVSDMHSSVWQIPPSQSLR